MQTLEQYEQERDWAGTVTLTPGRGGGFIGVELAAKLLDEPIDDVRRLCERGQFPGAYVTEFFLPRDWIIPPEAFRAYQQTKSGG